ncbi:MAG: CCA tRNA nucleotidyltransferase [Oligoflexia bacterium]|nr:CCA tRNA nucleotidyltransferase [Oligoflexia bacterium]
MWSDQIKQLLQFIFDQGFYLTLIGGAVRNYLCNKEMGYDLDFEIRSLSISHSQKSSHESGHESSHVISDLKSNLEKHFNQYINKISLNDYGVLIFDFNTNNEKYHFELALPRLEFFIDNNLSHKNFNYQFKLDLDYEQAFARRDFTINAIGIEIRELATNSWKIIDPYDGVNDLKNKLLIPITTEDKKKQTFHLDPVRFLRSIRFCIRDSYNFSSELCDTFPLFDLSKLSIHYFYEETIKSVEFVKFFKLFFNLIEKHKIKLAEKIYALRFLCNLPENLNTQKIALQKNNSSFNREDFLLFILENIKNSCAQSNSNNSQTITFEQFSLLWTTFGCSKQKLKIAARFN